ncbi:MAG: MBL fold metallo-hydrolase [Chitinivibrionales bacterium]|nr:MBL fold metallo-hydrolase [Chitinivibrionales bacterium]
MHFDNSDQTILKILREIYAGSNELSAKALSKLKTFEKRSTSSRTINRNDHFLEFPKQFSSYTPVMDSYGRKAVGGGYFLVINGYGCVIDPGHHFLQNFFCLGRTINDIDAIFVTHFHDDHYADLPALLSLLYRRSKAKPDSKVDVFLDSETFNLFNPILSTADYVGKLERLSSSKKLEYESPMQISAECLPTHHNVFGKYDTGVGLHFKLKLKGSSIIITGDTAWNEEIEKYYRMRFHELNAAKILIAHVSTVHKDEGAIIGADYYVENPMPHKNHLAIYGLCKCISATRPERVILSEIGEELEGIIDKIGEIISEHYQVAVSVARMGSNIIL